MNIAVVAAGSSQTSAKMGENAGDPYEVPKEAGIFVSMDSGHAVTTSAIRERIVTNYKVSTAATARPPQTWRDPCPSAVHLCRSPHLAASLTTARCRCGPGAAAAECVQGESGAELRGGQDLPGGAQRGQVNATNTQPVWVIILWISEHQVLLHRDKVKLRYAHRTGEK